MSEAEEPGDARDWFGGDRPAEAERAEAAATPRPVAEAFGHLPKETAEGASDWFDAGVERAPAAPAASAFADFAAAPSTPGQPTAPAAAEPVPGAEPEPAAPETDPRVRLRALTGGLADLSDAMAAIGIESVAVRSTPGRPSGPDPAPAPAADFRVRCPDCGPQYVAIADVRFVETGDGADANRYLFTCPACGARVRRPAGPELAEILKSSGVATLALRRGPGQAL